MATNTKPSNIKPVYLDCATTPQSAQIIPLPGAAVQPVKQSRINGRLPKAVIALKCARRTRVHAADKDVERNDLIQKYQSYIAESENYTRNTRACLDALSRPGRKSTRLDPAAPIDPATWSRIKTGIKAHEAIPAYGVGDGVLTFRHGLLARERGVLDQALAIVGRSLRETHFDFPSPEAVKTYLQLHLAGEQHERFAVLFLDVQNRLLAFETMSVGTLAQTSVYPREIVCAALAHDAAAVILAHNHPSGNTNPSQADQALTQTIKTTLALIDVRVLDHVIVAPGEALSMAERGIL